MTRDPRGAWVSALSARSEGAPAAGGNWVTGLRTGPPRSIVAAGTPANGEGRPRSAGTFPGNVRLGDGAKESAGKIPEDNAREEGGRNRSDPRGISGPLSSDRALKLPGEALPSAMTKRNRESGQQWMNLCKK